ncbi:MAG: hypothetical protein AB7O97_22685 [Planctomycetota bacterium]
MARSLLLFALLGFSSCTTGVLVADPDLGFEGAGARYVRLRLETVQLDVVEVPPGEFRVPGALCLAEPPPGGGAPCRALRFRLPFLAWNGTDESWPVRLGMFSLERRPNAEESGAGASGAGASGADALRATDGGETVALLAPNSGAHFDVLVHVAGVGPDEDPLRGVYVLTVRTDAGGGETLLQKTLSVGSFDQLSQFGRFLGSATLFLVAVAAL